VKSLRRFLIALSFLGFFTSSLNVAGAQTLAEMVVVTSIVGTLDSSIRLPTGSFQVTNPKYAAEFADMLGADKAKYTNFTLYVATGIAARLAPSYINDLMTGFAVSGYFESGRSEQKVGGDVRTRIDFNNSDTNKNLLLFIVRRADRVYFLVAAKK
jgi:hypothetical protein